MLFVFTSQFLKTPCDWIKMDAFEFCVNFVLLLLLLPILEQITVFGVPLIICLYLGYQDRDLQGFKTRTPVFKMSMACTGSIASSAPTCGNWGLF